LPASSLRIVALLLITTFRKNPLCTLSCTYVVACRFL
jgi:hypothetical protein